MQVSPVLPVATFNAGAGAYETVAAKNMLFVGADLSHPFAFRIAFRDAFEDRILSGGSQFRISAIFRLRAYANVLTPVVERIAVLVVYSLAFCGFAKRYSM